MCASVLRFCFVNRFVLYMSCPLLIWLLLVFYELNMYLNPSNLMQIHCQGHGNQCQQLQVISTERNQESGVGTVSPH